MTDGTMVTLISLAVTFLFMLGVPVLLVIGYWVIGCSFVLGLTLDNMGAELLNVFNKGFALLAMPLFILTGDLINKSGIARRLSDFAYACLGWIRGGLAMASLGACGLFAAISGSNSATTATIGSMLHPEMVKGGYDERFSAATAAAGGTVGIIIPPSIIFHRLWLPDEPADFRAIRGGYPSGRADGLWHAVRLLDHLPHERLGSSDPAATEPGAENCIRCLAWILCHRAGAVGYIHRQILTN